MGAFSVQLFGAIRTLWCKRFQQCVHRYNNLARRRRKFPRFIAYVGAVRNLKDPGDYSGPFYCTSGSFLLGVMGARLSPNATLCSAANGVFSVTTDLTGTAGEVSRRLTGGAMRKRGQRERTTDGLSERSAFQGSLLDRTAARCTKGRIRTCGLGRRPPSPASLLMSPSASESALIRVLFRMGNGEIVKRRTAPKRRPSCQSRFRIQLNRWKDRGSFDPNRLEL